MQKKDFTETSPNNREEIGAYSYVRGRYYNNILATRFGSYPATLSPKCISSLQTTPVDFAELTLMKVVPVTKPEVSEYNNAGKQRPYLGFIIEEVNPTTPPEDYTEGKVIIRGKVINEKRRYGFALLKVYYPYMLNQHSIIKINGVLEGYGNALDSIYEVEAEVRDNELVVTRSTLLKDNIEVVDYLKPRKRQQLFS